ncbi:hypothetical protein Sango_0807100 [Sesamum angolense]|uniref:Retrotransposon gag domain-containing protein n=1 Tax=Sesamum angolense TaxID=2727404 RepID=A0AAE1X357_9LAMI|nr:hypothetical protein Sango_0807100 [Sesamum angolense]
MDEEGQTHTNPEGVVNEFLSFYQRLLGGDRKRRFIDLRHLRSWARYVLTDEESMALIKPVAQDDIKTAFVTGRLLKQVNVTLLDLIPNVDLAPIVLEPSNPEVPNTMEAAPIGDILPQWLARFEYIQKGLQDVQYQMMGAPTEEQAGIPFTEGAAQQWFNQLHLAVIGNFQEFCSLFLHQFASSKRQWKTELSLFSIRQKKGEPLKQYLQRFNIASLEVPSATQEVKTSAFAQGLLDGDFFKSLAKKSTARFDGLLARATKYINMEDTQAYKREGRGEKRKESKEEGSSKKPKTDFKDKKPVWQRINTVYTLLTVPIT